MVAARSLRRSGRCWQARYVLGGSAGTQKRLQKWVLCSSKVCWLVPFTDIRFGVWFKNGLLNQFDRFFPPVADMANWEKSRRIFEKWFGIIYPRFERIDLRRNWFPSGNSRHLNSSNRVSNREFQVEWWGDWSGWGTWGSSFSVSYTRWHGLRIK